MGKLWERVSGNWTEIKQPWENVNGTWTKIKAVWEKVDGVWQRIWEALPPHEVLFAINNGKFFVLNKDGEIIYSGTEYITGSSSERLSDGIESNYSKTGKLYAQVRGGAAASSRHLFEFTKTNWNSYTKLHASGREPHYLAMNKDGTRLYFTNYEYRTNSAICFMDVNNTDVATYRDMKIDGSVIQHINVSKNYVAVTAHSKIALLSPDDLSTIRIISQNETYTYSNPVKIRPNEELIHVGRNTATSSSKKIELYTILGELIHTFVTGTHAVQGLTLTKKGCLTWDSTGIMLYDYDYYNWAQPITYYVGGLSNHPLRDIQIDYDENIFYGKNGSICKASWINGVYSEIWVSNVLVSGDYVQAIELDIGKSYRWLES